MLKKLISVLYKHTRAKIFVHQTRALAPIGTASAKIYDFAVKCLFLFTSTCNKIFEIIKWREM